MKRCNAESEEHSFGSPEPIGASRKGKEFLKKGPEIITHQKISSSILGWFLIIIYALYKSPFINDYLAPLIDDDFAVLIIITP